MLAEPIRPDADGVLRVPATPGLGIRARRRRDQAVRGVTATEPRRLTAEDWLERAATVKPRTELFIDGRFVAAASGRTDGRRRGSGRRHDRRGRRRRFGGRVAGCGGRPGVIRRWSMVGSQAGGPQARVAPARRADAREPRRARAPGVSRRRPPDPRCAQRRRDVLGGHDPVVRGDDRQGLRRDRSERARNAVVRDPRADRRGRGHRALELSVDHHRLEAGGGIVDGQLGRVEARVAVAADGPPSRRAGVGGRSSGRRAERRHRAWGGGRRCPRPSSFRRQGRIHRFWRDRQVAPARPRRVGRQGDFARARWQEPAGRPRRRWRSRGGRVRHRVGDLLQQRPDLQRRIPAHRPPFGSRGTRGAGGRAWSEAGAGRAARPEDAARGDGR